VRDVEIGRFGLRTFRVDRDGQLLPIVAGDRFDWKDGVCFAECKVGAFHRPPAEGCSCGIYSFHSLEDLRSQYSAAANVVAVVAPEGHARIGGNGLVSERARVVALWTADPRLTELVRNAVSENIQPYTDLDTMVVDHHLRFTATPAAAEDFLPARHAAAGLVSEVIRSAAGIGWAKIVYAASLALIIMNLVKLLADPGVRSLPEPVPSAASLIAALDRFLLSVGTSMTPIVVTFLCTTLIVAVLRASVRVARGGAAGAAGRLFRHAATMTLRAAIVPLVVVAAYGVIHGRAPALELVAWILTLIVASSWSSGGALYHLIAGIRFQLRQRRSVNPIDPMPALRPLLGGRRRWWRGSGPA
jgi:hypothetical protein